MMRAPVLLEKNELAKITAKAIRRGVWFRLLTTSGRAIMDLTMKIVEKIRSFILAKGVSSILKKFLDVMESKVARLVREAEQALARKLSRIARNRGKNPPSTGRMTHDLCYV